MTNNFCIETEIASKLLKQMINTHDWNDVIINQFLEEFGPYLNYWVIAKVDTRCTCCQLESFKVTRPNTTSRLEEIVKNGKCDDYKTESQFTDNMGFQPIHIAAGFGLTVLMQQMIKRGAGIYSTTLALNLKPFEIAIGTKQYEVARLLIDCGFTYTNQNGGHKLVFSCIYLGQLTGAKLCVNAGVKVSQDLWSSAMQRAIDFNHCDIVDWLLDIGPGKINDPLDSTECRTPLQFSHTLKMANLLLSRGADPTISGNEWGNALTTHVIFENLEICEAILKAYPCIINMTTDSSEGERKHYSALHYAAWRGSLAAVDLLLHYGADPHMVTYDGNTALGLACHVDSLPCVEKFVSLNCDPNVSDKDDDTALIYASFNGNHKVCELLLDSDADPSMKNKSGVTPLWSAVYGRSLQIVIRLLSMNVQPDVRSRGVNIHTEGDYIYDVPVSPLFVAIHLEEISLAKALINAGCLLSKEMYSIPNFSQYVEHWAEDNRRWLTHMTSSPPKLMWWCKREIRKNLPIKPHNSVSVLQIPKNIKTYLLEV